jgi:hypothetical protein
MIDERQFQIGESCTYHTTTTIDMINISKGDISPQLSDPKTDVINNPSMANLATTTNR